MELPFFPEDTLEVAVQQSAMLAAGIRLPAYLFRGFVCK